MRAVPGEAARRVVASPLRCLRCSLSAARWHQCCQQLSTDGLAALPRMPAVPPPQRSSVAAACSRAPGSPGVPSCCSPHPAATPILFRLPTAGARPRPRTPARQAPRRPGASRARPHARQQVRGCRPAARWARARLPPRQPPSTVLAAATACRHPPPPSASAGTMQHIVASAPTRGGLVRPLRACGAALLLRQRGTARVGRQGATRCGARIARPPPPSAHLGGLPPWQDSVVRRPAALRRTCLAGWQAGGPCWCPAWAAHAARSSALCRS